MNQRRKLNSGSRFFALGRRLHRANGMRVGIRPAASLDYGERGSSTTGPVRSACWLGYQESGTGKPYMYGMQKSDEPIVPMKRRTVDSRGRNSLSPSWSLWREGVQVWQFSLPDTLCGTLRPMFGVNAKRRLKVMAFLGHDWGVCFSHGRSRRGYVLVQIPHRLRVM